MKMKIAQRYRPFSHQPGVSCFLPRTHLVVQVFPARIVVKDLFDLPLKLRGPVREFTVQQDLERGCVLIWGVASGERFRLCLRATPRTIELIPERSPQFQPMTFPHLAPVHEPRLPLERLSLGNHKDQHWEQVLRRFDTRELLPVLFHLSQWTPPTAESEPSEMGALFEQNIESFLRAGFSGIFTPRWVDEDHQGLLTLTKAPPNDPPHSLVQEAGRKIRALFFGQEKEVLKFPEFPFVCGRMNDVHAEGIGRLDFEWTNHTLRGVSLSVDHDAHVRFELPSSLSSFRFREARRENGKRTEAREGIEVSAGKTYLLDRFQ